MPIHRRMSELVAAVLVFIYGGAVFGGTPSYFLERVVDGLHQPTDAAFAPGDPYSLYIVERTTPTPNNPNANLGRVLRFDMTTQTMHTFLDLSTIGGAISSDSGLLAMTFHPDFQSNGKFYVASSVKIGTDPWMNRLEEFRVGIDGNPVFERTILQYRNNQSNEDPNSSVPIHTIDWLGFHPHAQPGSPERNYLYITTGDGGPQASNSFFVNKSQDLGEIYGKLLRIDISEGADAYPGDPDKNFGIPADNPSQPGKLGEVIASGFRNPWRAGIDRLHGDIFIGDVGFNSREEINFFRADWTGVPDYGWPQREGTQQTPGAVGGPQGDSLNPILEYPHAPSDRQSVTGGVVYRGPIAELYGKYIFADFISNRVFTFEFDRDTDPLTFNGNNVSNLTDVTSLFESLIDGGGGAMTRITSFVEDELGNLYIVSFASGEGNHYQSRGEGVIYRIIPEPAGAGLLFLVGAVLLRRARRREPAA